MASKLKVESGQGKRKVTLDGELVAYLIEHRNQESVSYRMVGDPKQHHVSTVKLALAHILRKV